MAKGSVFGLLRERGPGAVPMTVPRRALVGFSRAIEDEYAFQSRSGVALAAFQSEDFYRDAERRWRALAEQSELTAVLAGFRDPCEIYLRPLEVPLRQDHPLADEWVVVCDCLGWSACLAAVEVDRADGGGPKRRSGRRHAGPRSDLERRYEAVWTMESSSVRAAARLLLTVAEEYFPHLRGSVPLRILDIPAGEPVAPRALREMTQRFLDYAGADREGQELPADFEHDWGRAGFHERGAEAEEPNVRRRFR